MRRFKLCKSRRVRKTTTKAAPPQYGEVGNAPRSSGWKSSPSLSTARSLTTAATMAASQPPGIDPNKTYSVRVGSLKSPSTFVLRYDFKPQSVDSSKPGLMTRSSTDKVFVDWHNQSSDSAPIAFTGKFETGKDIDCVLVLDAADEGTFVLEPMASIVKCLSHDRLGGQAAAQRLASLPDQIEPQVLPNIDQVIQDSDGDGPILDMSGRPVEEFDDIEGSDVSFEDD